MRCLSCWVSDVFVEAGRSGVCGMATMIDSLRYTAVNFSGEAMMTFKRRDRSRQWRALLCACGWISAIIVAAC